MLTYALKKAPGLPLYESLYRCLREDIGSGTLPAGTRLPSKRALAQNLKVSRITVENAYQQLVSEGYVRSVERVGYFVEADTPAPPPPAHPAPPEREPEGPLLDFTANGPADFPFSVWSRLQREVMLDYGKTLLRPAPNQGCMELRRAIADHLFAFRGMRVAPENILIGAGTDFLYNLLIQLLGRDRICAVEEPGYDKIRRIYAAGGLTCVSAPMDDFGVVPEKLCAQVLHISPSHHFPTGIVTPLARRQELLAWARAQNAYIIEDDYDSEFRFHAHPLPALQAMDRQGRVIYLNTFSKSLAPSIRVSYLVLPEALMAKFQKELGFYGCTVPGFSQYTLARFLERGYFEKHINRMRRFYRGRRDRVLAALDRCPWAKGITVRESDAGLHFLLQIDAPLTDVQIVEIWAKAGIRVRPLGEYYSGSSPESAARTLVINYSGLDEHRLDCLNQLPALSGIPSV